jgi:hypothetical protein
MGALQGIGTPAGFAPQPALWGGPWGGLMQGGHPYTQSLAPQLSGISLVGYPGTVGAFGGYPQQQQVLQFLQLAVQQAQYVVPLQLQQIQQLVQLLAQQFHHTPYGQGLQPFQIPSIGPSPWLAATQSGQAQPFGGQPGYVM